MHTDFFLLLWQSWLAIEPERRGLGRADTQGHLASLRGRAQCWTSDQIWVNTGQSFVNDENLYEFLSALCRQGGLTPSSQVGMWRGSRGWRINTLLHGYGGYRQQTASETASRIAGDTLTSQTWHHHPHWAWHIVAAQTGLQTTHHAITTWELNMVLRLWRGWSEPAKILRQLNLS